ncbi:PTS sugar transporter subunit IIA [Agromyces kandeliae]|uniref:Ascorbate-specific PTS system EIIA component n=1 Tax=Agromyces kandeliae TaxID=2666141 RepID=A0A6L5QZ53_9MICO|nr:PTS sugar transporter subunit IIA [Agromyces kandeliae]MRX42935.1 PTS sugar transporter subunit IIA [Agromyces kandeliae]
MTLPPLPDDAIVLRVDVADWRDAVRAAGRALARSGATLPGYADRMIDVLEEFGAYIVIAPGLALAHARPGPDVRRSGLAVVTLADPVAFGHPHNDPVRVVLGLAVSNAEEHVASVADLANVFNERDAIDRIAAAETPAEVRAVLHVSGGEGRPATDAAGAPS